MEILVISWFAAGLVTTYLGAKLNNEVRLWEAVLCTAAGAIALVIYIMMYPPRWLNPVIWRQK